MVMGTEFSKVPTSSATSTAYDNLGQLETVFEDVVSPSQYGQTDPTVYGQVIDIDYEDRGFRKKTWGRRCTRSTIHAQRHGRSHPI